jgi:hypothetical protein
MTWAAGRLAGAAVRVALAALVAGCAAPRPGSPPPARCAAEPVQLLDPVPLFTGPQANAALDRALQKGQRLQLCGVQGQRRQVLLPRAGQRCSGPGDCASGWVPANARTGALR